MTSEKIIELSGKLLAEAMQLEADTYNYDGNEDADAIAKAAAFSFACKRLYENAIVEHANSVKGDGILLKLLKFLGFNVVKSYRY